MSMLLNNQKSSTPPFFVLLFGLCVCVCAFVCVSGWEWGWGGGGVGVAVMCLTDIEDNCPLSSSCLCNSNAAAA